MLRLTAALLMAPTAQGAGSYDVCREPVPESSFRAGYRLYEDVRLAGGDLGRDNWAADLVFRNGDDWLIGGSYRGTLLDESEVGFRTNGYLHSFYFQLHRLRTGDERVRWAVAPATVGLLERHQGSRPVRRRSLAIAVRRGLGMAGQ